MKKIFLSIVTMLLMSGVAVYADGGKKNAKKAAAKQACTKSTCDKSKCADKAKCHKSTCTMPCSKQ